MSPSSRPPYLPVSICSASRSPCPCLHLLHLPISYSIAWLGLGGSDLPTQRPWRLLHPHPRRARSTHGSPWRRRALPSLAAAAPSPTTSSGKGGPIPTNNSGCDSHFPHRRPQHLPHRMVPGVGPFPTGGIFHSGGLQVQRLPSRVVSGVGAASCAGMAGMAGTGGGAARPTGMASPAAARTHSCAPTGKRLACPLQLLGGV